MSDTLILASASPHRRKLLDDAGLEFDVAPADIDERAAEQPLKESGATPADIAQVLAEAKALEVSARNPGAIVIGADQTLSLEDEVFYKPEDMDAVARQILKLAGKTHALNSAVVLARDGAILWRYVGTAHLTMRPLDPAYVGRYLSMVGDKALSSVGGYQIEGPGVRLFRKIEGDFFTIVGLPMLPLLDELLKLGVIDG
ncbi:Maf-like protein [Hoeflea sp. CAU 1731]